MPARPVVQSVDLHGDHPDAQSVLRLVQVTFPGHPAIVLEKDCALVPSAHPFAGPPDELHAP